MSDRRSRGQWHPQKWCRDWRRDGKWIVEWHSQRWGSDGRRSCGQVAVRENGSELAQGLNFSVGERSKRGGWRGMLECMEDVLDAGCDEVGGRGEWHFYGCGGEPGNGVRDVLLFGGPNPGSVAAIGG